MERPVIDIVTLVSDVPAIMGFESFENISN